MAVSRKKGPARVLAIGLGRSLPDADGDEFYTERHFFDYDVVIVDPRGALEGRNHKYEVLMDVLRLNSEPGRNFVERFIKTAQKFIEFVNEGGMGVIFVRHMPVLKYPDHREPDNRIKHDLNDYLWGGDKVRSGHGVSIEFLPVPPFVEFWNATNDIWSYEAVFVEPSHTALAHVRNHPEQVLASYVSTEKRGVALMTPVLTLDKTRQAETAQKFIEAIRVLHEAISTKTLTPALPEWAENYSLPGELELRDEISTAERRVLEVQTAIKSQTEALSELCEDKILFTGSDSALEAAVDRVLTGLGMQVTPGPKKRVDRLARYGDRAVAVEVQGVKRGAKEDHARSLIQWVQEIAMQEGKEPKGLLVVNPYRDTPLADRTANFWPGEIEKICTRQGFCAMTGIQLLGLYFEARSEESKREELIERIFETEGLFQGYEEWSDFLSARRTLPRR